MIADLARRSGAAKAPDPVRLWAIGAGYIWVLSNEGRWANHIWHSQYSDDGGRTWANAGNLIQTGTIDEERPRPAVTAYPVMGGVVIMMQGRKRPQGSFSDDFYGYGFLISGASTSSASIAGSLVGSAGAHYQPHPGFGAYSYFGDAAVAAGASGTQSPVIWLKYSDLRSSFTTSASGSFGQYETGINHPSTIVAHQGADEWWIGRTGNLHHITGNVKAVPPVPQGDYDPTAVYFNGRFYSVTSAGDLRESASDSPTGWTVVKSRSDIGFASNLPPGVSPSGVFTPQVGMLSASAKHLAMTISYFEEATWKRYFEVVVFDKNLNVVNRSNLLQGPGGGAFITGSDSQWLVAKHVWDGNSFFIYAHTGGAWGWRISHRSFESFDLDLAPMPPGVSAWALLPTVVPVHYSNPYV